MLFTKKNALKFESGSDSDDNPIMITDNKFILESISSEDEQENVDPTNKKDNFLLNKKERMILVPTTKE